MKNKTSLALLLCVLSGLILVGCNQAPSNSSTDTNTPPSTNMMPSTNK